MVVQAADGEAQYFDLPDDLVLQVPLVHPKYPWFEQMGLRWYAVPGVSCLKLDCGGLEFSAIPFNGWYMVTEIGTRDLADPQRYNLAEKVAVKMGLDTATSATMWKDKAVIELNIAVLHSFQKSNVTIMDHHTSCETFMKHLDTEFKLRGGCPGDWLWLIPPTSGSLVSVYHQEILSYQLKPMYDYQDHPWKKYDWSRHGNIAEERKSKNYRFREIARAVRFSSKLFGKVYTRRTKATILYATETGKSMTYANQLAEIFNRAFAPQVICMADYDVTKLEHEHIVLVVASTFGNGDPPENGESFAKALQAMKAEAVGTAEGVKASTLHSLLKTESGPAGAKPSDDTAKPLENVRFSVFALGSTAYPIYCAFGKGIDTLMKELGAESLNPVACGDELSGQEQSFKEWAVSTYKMACRTFCIQDSMENAPGLLRTVKKTENSVRFRILEEVETNGIEDSWCSDLSKLHSRTVLPLQVVLNQNLTPGAEGLETLKVALSWKNVAPELLKKPVAFVPGDHVGIMPTNRFELVEGVLQRLTNCQHLLEWPVEVQLLEEIPTMAGPKRVWKAHPKLPRASIVQLLSNFLDITTPPTQQLLSEFAERAVDLLELQRLTSLSTNAAEYETWKHGKWPHLLEVLQEFPSVKMDAALLMSLLPIQQPHFYSISSSLKALPDEVHLTVGVVSLKTQGEFGKEGETYEDGENPLRLVGVHRTPSPSGDEDSPSDYEEEDGEPLRLRGGFGETDETGEQEQEEGEDEPISVIDPATGMVLHPETGLVVLPDGTELSHEPVEAEHPVEAVREEIEGIPAAIHSDGQPQDEEVRPPSAHEEVEAGLPAIVRAEGDIEDPLAMTEPHYEEGELHEQQDDAQASAGNDSQASDQSRTPQKNYRKQKMARAFSKETDAQQRQEQLIAVEQIRAKVKKGFAESLLARKTEAQNIKMTDEAVIDISSTIEDALFNLFKETGAKYMRRCRCLISKIEDTTDAIFFINILTGKIRPDELAQMSPDELAYKEWQERESNPDHGDPDYENHSPAEYDENGPPTKRVHIEEPVRDKRKESKEYRDAMELLGKFCREMEINHEDLGKIKASLDFLLKGFVSHYREIIAALILNYRRSTGVVSTITETLKSLDFDKSMIKEVGQQLKRLSKLKKGFTSDALSQPPELIVNPSTGASNQPTDCPSSSRLTLPFDPLRNQALDLTSEELSDLKEVVDTLHRYFSPAIASASVQFPPFSVAIVLVAWDCFKGFKVVHGKKARIPKWGHAKRFSSESLHLDKSVCLNRVASWYLELQSLLVDGLVKYMEYILKPEQRNYQFAVFYYKDVLKYGKLTSEDVKKKYCKECENDLGRKCWNKKCANRELQPEPPARDLPAHAFDIELNPLDLSEEEWKEVRRTNEEIHTEHVASLGIEQLEKFISDGEN